MEMMVENKEQLQEITLLGELPMDLVEEILLRLEVKHILRCKLVSKNVYTLIKSPRFVSAHLHGSKYNKRRIAVLGNNYVSDVLYLLSPQSNCFVPSIVRSGNTISLMGSCHGLLCILKYSPDKEYQTLLLNPATGEYRALPIRKNCSRDGFGFGYDAASGDYKVVKICSYCCSRRSFSVWSSKTNEWTKVPFAPSALSNLIKDYDITSGLFVKGNLYWIARPEFECRFRPDILFSVSLADHTVRQIPMPDVVVQENYRNTELTEYMGPLAMFVGGHTYSGCYDLWVMEDNEDGKIAWAKRLSNIGPFLLYTCPTGVCVNGDFVMKNLVHDKGFLYNSRSMEKKELPFSDFRWPRCMVWSLDESLVCP